MPVAISFSTARCAIGEVRAQERCMQAENRIRWWRDFGRGR